MIEETVETVVCDCGHRWTMSKVHFKQIALGNAKNISCSKCHIRLNELIKDLQMAIDGGKLK